MKRFSEISRIIQSPTLLLMFFSGELEVGLYDSQVIVRRFSKRVGWYDDKRSILLLVVTKWPHEHDDENWNYQERRLF